jgi:hypothetical protein
MKQYNTFSNLIDVVRTNPQSLETVVCESKGKTRKISKTCAQNIVAYLGGGSPVQDLVITEADV